MRKLWKLIITQHIAPDYVKYDALRFVTEVNLAESFALGAVDYLNRHHLEPMHADLVELRRSSQLDPSSLPSDARMIFGLLDTLTCFQHVHEGDLASAAGRTPVTFGQYYGSAFTGLLTAGAERPILAIKQGFLESIATYRQILADQYTPGFGSQGVRGGHVALCDLLLRTESLPAHEVPNGTFQTDGFQVKVGTVDLSKGRRNMADLNDDTRTRLRKESPSTAFFDIAVADTVKYGHHLNKTVLAINGQQFVTFERAPILPSYAARGNTESLAGSVDKLAATAIRDSINGREWQEVVIQLENKTRDGLPIALPHLGSAKGKKAALDFFKQHGVESDGLLPLLPSSEDDLSSDDGDDDDDYFGLASASSSASSSNSSSDASSDEDEDLAACSDDHTSCSDSDNCSRRRPNYDKKERADQANTAQRKAERAAYLQKGCNFAGLDPGLTFAGCSSLHATLDDGTTIMIPTTFKSTTIASPVQQNQRAQADIRHRLFPVPVSQLSLIAKLNPKFARTARFCRTLLSTDPRIRHEKWLLETRTEQVWNKVIASTIRGLGFEVSGAEWVEVDWLPTGPSTFPSIRLDRTD